MSNERPIPRRCILSECKPAELKISQAIDEIELLGADVRLTDAINLLDKARALVSDVIDESFIPRSTSSK